MRAIQQILQQSITVQQQLLQDETLLQTLCECVGVIIHAFNNGHRVFFCGNGGSAADAQHLAAELCGRFYLDRDALPAEALHCNTSYLTAVANDYGFDMIYARMIQGTANKGDVLVGLSTSGNSANILNAFKMAKEKGMASIAFTGASGGALKHLADYLLPVPSSDTPRIQENHILLGHILCQLVEAGIFAPKVS